MVDTPATRASLLLRLRNSEDGTTWREFVDLYAPMVYRYARSQGLQDADASDLSQDVLMAVAGSISRLDYDPARGAFRNWLFTVIRRKLLNWRRAQGSRVRGSGDSAIQEILETCPAPEDSDPAWDVEWEQRLFAWACQQVRRDVADVTWQAFWKTFIDGQPIRQVAADLGQSVAAVYVARSRILARLRELIQSESEQES